LLGWATAQQVHTRTQRRLTCVSRACLALRPHRAGPSPPQPAGGSVWLGPAADRWACCSLKRCQQPLDMHRRLLRLSSPTLGPPDTRQPRVAQSRCTRHAMRHGLLPVTQNNRQPTHPQMRSCLRTWSWSTPRTPRTACPGPSSPSTTSTAAWQTKQWVSVAVDQPQQPRDTLDAPRGGM
jgi:hypothetical protein